jgi:hypothetical protein
MADPSRLDAIEHRSEAHFKANSEEGIGVLRTPFEAMTKSELASASGSIESRLAPSIDERPANHQGM